MLLPKFYISMQRHIVGDLWATKNVLQVYYSHDCCCFENIKPPPIPPPPHTHTLSALCGVLLSLLIHHQAVLQLHYCGNPHLNHCCGRQIYSLIKPDPLLVLLVCQYLWSTHFDTLYIYTCSCISSMLNAFGVVCSDCFWAEVIFVSVYHVFAYTSHPLAQRPFSDIWATTVQRDIRYGVYVCLYGREMFALSEYICLDVLLQMCVALSSPFYISWMVCVCVCHHCRFIQCCLLTQYCIIPTIRLLEVASSHIKYTMPRRIGAEV